MAIRLTSVLLLFCLQLSLTSVKSMEDEINSEENCEGITCIRKCCPDGTMLNISFCDVPLDEHSLWKPSFYDYTTPPPTPPNNLKYIYGVMDCDAFPIAPNARPEDVFYLQQNGKLYVPIYEKFFSTAEYCIDMMMGLSANVTETALLCFETDSMIEPSTACKVAKIYIYPVLLMVSCVFLTITLGVYICIPELHGKLHGRCLMSMISSMLVAYILIFVVYVASDKLNPTACMFCASVKHITLLASFFWLNVMCFDIWRSLKSMRPASETSAKSRQRFCLYSLYAWGAPLIIGIVAVIIDSLPDSYNVIRPNFVNSREFCWFDGNKSIWFYFYMMVLILVIANICFFLNVAWIILKSQNNQRLQTARSQNRDRLWLYGKLFLVMGITWITELISWKQGTCEAWIITDVINALQGFIIFLIFVCKKTTRQMILKRASTKNRPKSSGATTTTSTGKRTSTFFTRLNTSSTGQTTDSSLSYSLEQHRSTDNAGRAATTEAAGVTHEEHVEPISQNYSAEVEEDCPSIRRDSDISDSDEETISSKENHLEVRQTESPPEESVTLINSENRRHDLPITETEIR